MYSTVFDDPNNILWAGLADQHVGAGQRIHVHMYSTVFDDPDNVHWAGLAEQRVGGQRIHIVFASTQLFLMTPTMCSGQGWLSRVLGRVGGQQRKESQ